MTAAWVDGAPIPVSEVDAELARLRSGPLAARLPVEGTQDARQLRRWVTQRLVVRRLLEHEAGSAPDAVVPPPDPAVLGSVAADVVATSAAARAVLARFDGQPPPEAVRAFHSANPDRYARPERWLVRQAFLPSAPPSAPPGAVADGPPDGVWAALRDALSGPVEVDPGTLVPALREQPDGPVRSALGWHLLEVLAVRPAGAVPYEQVRDEIAAELSTRLRQQAFARWLDEALAHRVRLAPGYEHPADPANPDATHRH